MLERSFLLYACRCSISSFSSANDDDEDDDDEDDNKDDDDNGDEKDDGDDEFACSLKLPEKVKAICGLRLKPRLS